MLANKQDLERLINAIEKQEEQGSITAADAYLKDDVNVKTFIGVSIAITLTVFSLGGYLPIGKDCFMPLVIFSFVVPFTGDIFKFLKNKIQKKKTK